MRPRGMRSKWVKLLPRYYTERRQPTRAVERRCRVTAREHPSEAVNPDD